jgi:hypothetical protein
MSFDHLTSNDVASIQRELVTAVSDRCLPLTSVKVCLDDANEEVQVHATVTVDPALSGGNATHSEITILVRLFTLGEDDDQPVILASIRYAVAKEFSNFFPVPAEYGQQVSVWFSWEFDRYTLTFGAAELRDRESVHFVSVSPNDYLIEFVKCCSESLEPYWQD